MSEPDKEIFKFKVIHTLTPNTHKTISITKLISEINIYNSSKIPIIVKISIDSLNRIHITFKKL